MNFVRSTEHHRKSGVWGTPRSGVGTNPRIRDGEKSQDRGTGVACLLRRVC
jgi:hypothetical protein